MKELGARQKGRLHTLHISLQITHYGKLLKKYYETLLII